MNEFLARIGLAFFLSASLATAFELPADCRQCILGLAPDWNSSRVQVRVFEKKDGGWAQSAGPWSGRLGKNGLAWGLGLHPLPTGVAAKREGDLRAPAGVFALGGAYGYAPAIEKAPGTCGWRIPPRPTTTAICNSPPSHARLGRKNSR